MRFSSVFARWAGPLLALTVLAGCATPKYTVDDGRKVDPVLLANLSRYSKVEQAARPAIVRTAALNDPHCDKQWELPFSVASSQAWSANDRVAWVRALNVDERLTVVSAAMNSPVRLGQRIVSIQGQQDSDADTMAEWLADLRDAGKPFRVGVLNGPEVTVKPFQVCRGYTRFAPPSTPESRDYHWLMSLHPLELADADLTEDEMMWVVLWTQGLSEEGGMRMKAFHYTTKTLGTLYNLFTIASGLKGAALAAEAAVKAAQKAAAQAVSEMVKQQILNQAKELAAQRIRSGLSDAAQQLVRQQVISTMQQAAAGKAALSGVAYVAGTVFDRADAWAFERAQRVAAQPLAGLSLHQKLAERGLSQSAFVFDAERLEALSHTAEAAGQGAAALAALNGISAKTLALEIGAMPLATAQKGFSYDDPVDAPSSSPFAQGLISGALALPIESRR